MTMTVDDAMLASRAVAMGKSKVNRSQKGLRRCREHIHRWADHAGQGWACHGLTEWDGCSSAASGRLRPHTAAVAAGGEAKESPRPLERCNRYRYEGRVCRMRREGGEMGRTRREKVSCSLRQSAGESIGGYSWPGTCFDRGWIRECVPGRRGRWICGRGQALGR